MTVDRNFNKQNRSNFIIIAAAIIGLLDSLYLSYVKLSGTQIYCTPGLGECDVVNASRWSILWGIPLGVYGVLGYTLLFLIAVFGKKIPFISKDTDLYLFAISLAGFLFSAYLTYLELFVLKAICQWCVLSAIMMTVIFIFSIRNLVVKSAEFNHPGGK